MLSDELCRATDIVLGTFHGLRHGLVAARQQEQQALARPTESRHELGTVLDGQSTGRTRSDINQAPVLLKAGFHGERRLLDRRPRRPHRGDGRQLPLDHRVEDVDGIPEVYVDVAWA